MVNSKLRQNSNKTKLRLGELSGLEVIQLMKQRVPEIPIVILLDEEAEDYVRAAERSGAKGYLAKAQVAEKLPTLLDKLSSEKRN